MVSIELPRFVEPPFRLDLTVMHEPMTPDRARHMVELQSFAATGRVLLASRLSQPGWCPKAERASARTEARGRVRFTAYLEDFDGWRAEHVPRSRRADQGKVPVLVAARAEPC
jgi:hypothetical protein